MKDMYNGELLKNPNSRWLEIQHFDFIDTKHEFTISSHMNPKPKKGQEEHLNDLDLGGRPKIVMFVENLLPIIQTALDILEMFIME